METHSRYKELLVVGVRMGIGGLNGWGQHHEVCVREVDMRELKQD